MRFMPTSESLTGGKPEASVLKLRCFGRLFCGDAEFRGRGGGEQALEPGDAAGSFQARREAFQLLAVALLTKRGASAVQPLRPAPRALLLTQAPVLQVLDSFMLEEQSRCATSTVAGSRHTGQWTPAACWSVATDLSNPSDGNATGGAGPERLDKHDLG